MRITYPYQILCVIHLKCITTNQTKSDIKIIQELFFF